MTEELTYTEKVRRVASIVTGMQQSHINAVIFRDIPEVWFQFYLGLYFDRPTAVLILEKDITEDIKKRLNHPDVELFPIEAFDEKSIEKFGEFLKKKVETTP